MLHTLRNNGNEFIFAGMYKAYTIPTAIICIIALTFNFTIALAQSTYSATLGPKLETTTSPVNFPLKVDNNGKLYSLSVKPGEEITVNRFNKDLSSAPAERITVNIKFGRDDFTIIEMGGKQWLLYKEYDKNLDKQWLYAKEIDLKSLTLKSDRKALLESDKTYMLSYKPVYSADSSKLAIITSCYNKKAKAATQYYAVVNTEMDVLEKKETIEYSMIGLFDIHLNNAGDIAFIHRTNFAMPRDMNKESTVLYVLRAGSTNAEETTLSTDGSKLNELRILHDKDGYLLIGTHNESGTPMNMNKIWIRRLTLTNQLIKFGEGDFAVSKEGTERRGVFLREVMLDKNGAITAVADCNDNGDLYIMNVAATGQMNWCTKIGRHYPEIAPGLRGFLYVPLRHHLFVINGEYNFVYLDEKENVGKGKSEPLSKYENKMNTALAIAKVSAGGKLSKEYVWQVSKGVGFPVLNEFVLTSTNRIVNKTVLMKEYISEFKQVTYSEDLTDRRLLEIKIND